MITNVTLTTKERYLLEDQKGHEEQCILKYSNYSNMVSNDQLRAIFMNNGKKEEEHLQTINQLLNGKIPTITSQQSSQQQPSQQQTSPQQTSQQQSQPQPERMAFQQQGGPGRFQASDKDLCIDALTTEKYISGTYDTAIFEFRDAQIRDVLNHIQKEEQKHGEAIFAYMESKGMYSAQ